MTKKHFIALGLTLQPLARELPTDIFARIMVEICAFCRAQNPRFNESRFRGFVAGTNGPNGGQR